VGPCGIGQLAEVPFKVLPPVGLVDGMERALDKARH
jgi:hypothetical protein